MKKKNVVFVFAMSIMLFAAGNVHAQEWNETYLKEEGEVKLEGEISMIEWTDSTLVTLTLNDEKRPLNKDKDPVVLPGGEHVITMGANGYGGLNFVVLMVTGKKSDTFIKFTKTGGITTITLQGSNNITYMRAKGYNKYWTCTVDKRASSFDQVTTYLAKSVPTKTIKSAVDKLKNSNTTKYANKDELAKDVAVTIMTGSTIASIGADMTPGVFAIPASGAAIVAQWTLKAQLVYAMSYIYGKEKTGDHLKADLIFLFSDPDMVEEALQELATGAVKEAADFVGKPIGAAVRATPAFKKIEEKVLAKVADKISVKVFGVASGAIAKGALKTLGWITMVYNAYKNMKDSVYFSAKAMTYYKYDKLDAYYAATNVTSTKNYSGTWYITAKNGSALHVSGASKDDNAGIVIFKGYDSNSKQSQWKFERQKDETYIITNVNSGKVIDVPSASKDNGAKLIQYTKKGGNNQKWRVEQIGDYVNLINANSGKAIDVPNNTTTNNTQVVQWSLNKNGNNQQFKLVAVK